MIRARVNHKAKTHKSPYDPDAILFSNFNSVASISQTSAPSMVKFM